MAQWKYGPFDIVYDEKLNTNLRLLRAAADAWATRPASAPQVDAVLAVLFRVFAASWSVYDSPRDRAEKARPLAQWLEVVDPAEDECAALARRNPAAAAALAAARNLLGDAARAWSAGNPEQPPTDHVLRELANALFRHRLLNRPPPARVDDCFGGS